MLDKGAVVCVCVRPSPTIGVLFDLHIIHFMNCGVARSPDTNTDCFKSVLNQLLLLATIGLHFPFLVLQMLHYPA